MDIYHRDGTPAVTTQEQAQLFRDMETPGHPDYRVVAKWHSPDGKYMVSTVFLAFDHNFFRGAPLIFETMIFANGDWGGVDTERYPTEAEAFAGHDKHVGLVQLIEGYEIATRPDAGINTPECTRPVGESSTP